MRTMRLCTLPVRICPDSGNARTDCERNDGMTDPQERYEWTRYRKQ